MSYIKGTIRIPTAVKILVSLLELPWHFFFPMHALFHYQKQPVICLPTAFSAWHPHFLPGESLSMNVPVLLIILLSTSAMLLLGLMLFALRHRDTHGATSFALLMAGESIWTIGYMFELLAPSYGGKIFWDNLQFIGTDLVAVGILLFSLRYTQRFTWAKRVARFLWIEPVLTNLLVWTDPLHHLVRINPHLNTSTGFPILDYGYGLWMWGVVLYWYLLIFSGVLLLIIALFRSHRHFKFQTLIAIVGITTPVTGTMFTALNLVPISGVPNLDIAPFMFALANPLWAWVLFRHRLLELGPIARDNLVEHMSDGMLVIDCQHRIVDVNPAACSLLSQSASALIGLPIEEVLPTLSSNLAVGNSHFSIEQQFSAPSDESQSKTLWIEITGSQIYNQRQRKAGWLILLRDRTHQHAMQTSLRKSEANLARAQAMAHLGSWEWDLQSNEFYWSDETYRICGIEPGHTSLTLEYILSLIHPEDQQPTMDVLNQAIAIRSPVTYEQRLIRSDGSERYLLENVEVTCDDDGNAIRILGTVQDITEQKRIEEQLRTNEARLQAIFDNAAAGIGVGDRQGRYTFVNQHAADTIGYTPDELYHMTPLDLVHPEDREAIQADIQAILSGQIRSYRREYRYLRKDGTLIWCDFSTNAIYNEYGEVDAVLGVLIDITEQKRIEEQLRTNEARLQAIFDNAAAGIVVGDRYGRYTFVNQHAADAVGYTTSEFYQLNSFDLIHPEDRTAMQADIQAIFQGKVASYRRERRYVRKDGNIIWCDLTTNAILNEQGAIDSVLGVLIDITDRKQMEDKLRKSEERLQHILDFSPHGVLVLDDTYIIQYASPLARELLQQPDLEGLPFGLPITSYDHCEVEVEVVPNRSTDRKTVLELRMIETEWENKPSYVVSMNDISDRKQVEEKLRKLSRAVEQSPSSVVITDTSGAIEYVNSSFTQVTGYTFREALGQNPRILKAGTLPHDFYQTLWKTITSGQEWRGEFHNKKKNGELFWEAASIAPIFNKSGRITHFVAVKEDITARKQMERELLLAREHAESANRAKSTFLANMSHELRTPLNAILGFTQILSQGQEIRSENREYLTIISRSGEHLLAIINDVLDMSKIEAGRVSLNETDFNLCTLLKSLNDMFRLRAKQKGLQLTCERDPHVPVHIRTDEQKLRQVLANLLSNAVKFTQQGSITLRITTEPLDSLEQRDYAASAQAQMDAAPVANSSMQLRFEVSDTGEGIADEDLPFLFEAFVQTQSGQKFQEGTGLGLPISQKFVELMGGTLQVRSEVGFGSTFTVDLPVLVVKAPQRDQEVQHRQVLALAHGQQPVRVLVVDDRLENRRLLVELLVSVGFIVREAGNGQQAIALWEKWEPHVIWMDMRMPVMDGYAATQHIKAQAQAQAPIIIGITASALQEEQTRMLAAGCDDFLYKPFEKHAIFEMLEKHLGVRFIYAETNGATEEIAEESLLTADMLQALPSEWVQNLHRNALLGDVNKLMEMISEVDQQDEQLATILYQLVDRYEFERILAVVGEVT
jgi:PAS domain S-box-containing protein